MSSPRTRTRFDYASKMILILKTRKYNERSPSAWDYCTVNKDGGSKLMSCHCHVLELWQILIKFTKIRENYVDTVKYDITKWKSIKKWLKWLHNKMSHSWIILDPGLWHYYHHYLTVSTRSPITCRNVCFRNVTLSFNWDENQ